ncbi:MAG: response regulator [Gammaproteobacteria bacterium]|jgi:DNA-binding NtrC family response regulator
MAARMQSTARKPRLLFVDDEERVLNSMRIMFRKASELHLAKNGKDAIDIIRNNDIDVIIADHKMPQMTGVELLTQVRTLSPRTVRILLTGYAELDAVEGSINEGEVFRFLTKPCPPDRLKETIALAVKAAQQTPAPAETAEPSPAPPKRTPVKKLPSAPPKTEEAGDQTAAVSKKRLAEGLGIVVFSADEEVLTAVQQAVRGRLPVYSASNVVKVVKILTERRPGVLVTDVSTDKSTIQAMTARLKEHLPELVTIAVSPHRDVLDMVWLINHGQIFRFLRKPITPGRCAVSLQAALKHHRMLLKNPEMVQRHQVETTDDPGLMGGMLTRIKNVRRLWSSL